MKEWPRTLVMCQDQAVRGGDWIELWRGRAFGWLYSGGANRVYFGCCFLISTFTPIFFIEISLALLLSPSPIGCLAAYSVYLHNHWPPRKPWKFSRKNRVFSEPCHITGIGVSSAATRNRDSCSWCSFGLGVGDYKWGFPTVPKKDCFR